MCGTRPRRWSAPAITCRCLRRAPAASRGASNSGASTSAGSGSRMAKGSAASFLAEYLVAHLQLGIRMLGRLRSTTVVHIHNPPDTLFASGMLARLLGRRVVYDLHDLAPELFAAKFGSTQGRGRPRRSAAPRHVDGVTRRGDERDPAGTRDRARPRRSRPRGAWCATGPGARRSRSATRRDRERWRSPGWCSSARSTCRTACSSSPTSSRTPGSSRATLTVIGDGPSRPDLERRAVELGVADRLVLTGRVEHARVPALIAEADIAVDPAPGTPLNHGSTMIKVAEYLAAGRPVVAYDLRETRRTAGRGRALRAVRRSRVRSRPSSRRSPLTARSESASTESARKRAPELVWEHSRSRACRAVRRTLTKAEFRTHRRQYGDHFAVGRFIGRREMASPVTTRRFG